MKKGMIILSLLLVISMFLSGCGTGSTAGGGTGGGSSPAVMDIFTNIITLQFLTNWGITAGPINPVEGFTRMLIIILLFSLFFWGSMQLPFGKPIAVTVSLVLAIMTGIFIPGTLLLTIASTYGAVFSALLLAIPIVLLLLAFWFLKDWPWIRVMILGLTWYVLKAGTESMGGWTFATAGSGPAYLAIIDGVLTWLNVLEWIVLIMTILFAVLALMSLFKGKSGAYDVKEGVKKLHNWSANRKHKSKTVDLRDYVEEEKELKNISVAKDVVDEAVALVGTIKSTGAIKSLTERDKVKGLIDEVEDEIDDSIREYGRVNRRTWKFHNDVDRLRKELKEKDKDVERIKLLSDDLLKEHKEAVDALKKAKADVAVAKTHARRIESEPAASFPPAAATAYAVVGSPIEVDVDGLIALLANIKTNLTEAETKQKKAIQDVQGVITESRELGLWK